MKTTDAFSWSRISRAKEFGVMSKEQGAASQSDMIALALLYSYMGVLLIQHGKSEGHPELAGMWGLPSCRIDVSEGIPVIGGMRQALRSKYGIRDFSLDEAKSYLVISPGQQNTHASDLTGFLIKGRVIEPDQLLRTTLNEPMPMPEGVVATKWQPREQLESMDITTMTPYSKQALGLYVPTDSDAVRVA